MTDPQPPKPRAERPRSGGARKPLDPDVRISKALSSTLRHNAKKEGLKIGDDGFVNVADLVRCPSSSPSTALLPQTLHLRVCRASTNFLMKLANNKYKSMHLTFDKLKEIVASNDKQRYSIASLNGTPATGPSADPSTAALLSTSTTPRDWQIRASQGHSLALSSLALIPLPSPGLLVHGTFAAAWPLILSFGGLSKMARQHIHFADYNEYQQGEVKSGMRRDAEIVIIVDGDKASREGGLRFERSDNGVVLTAGDEEGRVKMEWVQRVEERGTGRILWENGEVKNELSEELKKRGLPRGKGGRGGRGGGRGGRGGKSGGEGREVEGRKEVVVDSGEP